MGGGLGVRVRKGKGQDGDRILEMKNRAHTERFL